LAKKPESFDNIADVFKLSLSEMEKRFADLEKSVSGLKERLDKIKPDKASPISQRVDDLEDLIMVEQAGIIELKKMLSNVDQKFEGLSSDASVEKIENKIEEIEKRLSDLSAETSKFDSLKSGIDILSDKKAEMDMKIADLEEKIGSVRAELQSSSSQKYIEEVKNNKHSIAETNARLESIEEMIKDMNDGLTETEKSINKFKEFDKLTELSKDVEAKLQELRLMENETRRLSNNMETIQKKEKEIPNLKKDLEKIKDEIESIRTDMLSFVKKDGMGAITTGALADSVKKLDNRLSSLEEAQAETVKRLETVSGGKELLDSVDELGKRVDSLEKKTVPIATEKEKPVKTMLDDIYKSLSDAESRLADMEKKIAHIEEPSALFEAQTAELIDRFVFLESRLAALEASIRSTANKQPVILE
jgi:chromosome segregation ATPase